MPTQSRVRRVNLPDAGPDRLYFAQVREDPQLEIEALRADSDDTVVVVSSGGCTALSLLAAGAGRVVAVDLNPTQNHLVELKQLAVARLGREAALAFLGAVPAPPTDRQGSYRRLRADLSPAARAWWDQRPSLIGGGVLNAGVSERFIRLVMTVVRRAVHSPERVGRLLAATSLDEQRRFFASEWDNRRWRLLFAVILNRAVFRKAFDPAFFAHVETPGFAHHFRRVAAHTLTEVPVATNYFLHHLLTGRYPVDVPGGLPPYLDPDGAASVANAADRLTLVDGSVAAWLRTCPDASVDAFALSNIGEWLDRSGLDELFGEVARTAVPGARVVFRNFVGWTEVPDRWADVVVEDRETGERLIRRDRSGVQRRIAVCRVRKEAR